MQMKSEERNAHISEGMKPSILSDLMALQNAFKREISNLDKKRQEAVDKFVEESLKTIQTACSNYVVDLDFEENKLITAKQAAEFLGCTQKQIYQYTHRQQLNPVRVNGRSIRFRKKDLKLFAFQVGI